MRLSMPAYETEFAEEDIMNDIEKYGGGFDNMEPFQYGDPQEPAYGKIELDGLPDDVTLQTKAKRYYEFLGKRNGQVTDLFKSPHFGKRWNEFIGKRSAALRNQYPKRYMEFIGKRAPSNYRINNLK
ncbi:hypothetical protein DPMN_000364 [Dreissena polymorpha]|uniref:Uncharacterized protein n=1 Tax=Dreissena polymorpha TaxID=45954 RepID=A0A9D4MIV1_DREPO|nr:hypothetical protein DPMN_000364 [Dreissena polymorpha]